MNGAACPREPDVLRAVAREWRDEADGSVATHAAACGRCAQVRAAAEVLRADHACQAQAARVPSPAAMWWRLERRLRHERARRLQRMAFAAQAVALAAAAGGAAAVLQILAPWLAGSGSLAVGTWHAAVTVLTTWTTVTSAWTLPLAIIVATWVLLVPAALYLGLAAD